MTLNTFGSGKAVYIGTLSQQAFYHDLVAWLRTICLLHPLLKVPDTIEVSLRQKAGAELYFLLNHQSTPVRICFFKPMHDFLTEHTFSGNYDLPPHGSWFSTNNWRKRPPSKRAGAGNSHREEIKTPRHRS